MFFFRPTDRPAVNITNGEVIGWYMESKATAGKYIRAFKGIPFAKPPIKELRFLVRYIVTFVIIRYI